MGKVKSAVMDGELFAQDNYNVAREDFIKMSHKAFSPASIEARAAIDAFDVIQKDLNEYFKYSNGEGYGRV